MPKRSNGRGRRRSGYIPIRKANPIKTVDKSPQEQVQEMMDMMNGMSEYWQRKFKEERLKAGK